MKNMITEDYVSFETAKLLKEKGFDECCPVKYKYVKEFDRYLQTTEYVDTDFKKYYYPCPTLQMAMKWLREKHEIFIQPNIVFCYPIQYFATIFCYGDNLKTQQDVDTERFDTYKEACEAAIKYCLENII